MTPPVAPRNAEDARSQFRGTMLATGLSPRYIDQEQKKLDALRPPEQLDFIRREYRQREGELQHHAGPRGGEQPPSGDSGATAAVLGVSPRESTS